MLQICWSPGLRPGPRWGSLQRSPDLLARGEGARSPRTPPPFGLPGLKLRPCGPQASALRASPYRPHILNHGYAQGAPKSLLNRGPSETCYATAGVREAKLSGIDSSLQKFSEIMRECKMVKWQGFVRAMSTYPSKMVYSAVLDVTL